MQILKQNEGTLISEKELHEGIKYDGKTNDIILTAVFDTDFGCSYQLHDYPFDSQICTIDVSSPSNIINDVMLVPGTMTYSGLSKTLPQFEFNVGIITSTENGNLIKGYIQLKRIPFYHILFLLVLSYLILSYLILSYLILHYLTLPYFTLPYLTSSYLTLSYLI